MMIIRAPKFYFMIIILLYYNRFHLETYWIRHGYGCIFYKSFYWIKSQPNLNRNQTFYGTWNTHVPYSSLKRIAAAYFMVISIHFVTFPFPYSTPVTLDFFDGWYIASRTQKYQHAPNGTITVESMEAGCTGIVMYLVLKYCTTNG